jgi:hypothetical protein
MLSQSQSSAAAKNTAPKHPPLREKGKLLHLTRTPFDELKSIGVGAKKLGSLTTDIVEEGISEASNLGSQLLWTITSVLFGVILSGGIALYSLLSLTGELANIGQINWQLSPLQRELLFAGMNLSIIFAAILACKIFDIFRTLRSRRESSAKDDNESALTPQNTANSSAERRQTSQLNPTEPTRFDEIRREIKGTATRMGRAVERMLNPAHWIPSLLKLTILLGLGVAIFIWQRRRGVRAKKAPQQQAAPNSNHSGMRSLITLILWREVITPAFEQIVRVLARGISNEMKIGATKQP